MATVTNITKNTDPAIFLVSESGDFYLVGTNEDEFLITIKATGELINDTKQ